MRELALFAGAGGGILGGLLLGWRTVCAVEIDAYCRSVLLARQRDGCLSRFPIWDDICTFDGRLWRGHVDVISGGFPCVDISSAGKGAGITGKYSGLWSEFARIIGEVGPQFAFVENSPMLTVRGLGAILGDLASLGYDARWGVLGAWHVGAPHRRDRMWIVAHPNGDRTQGRAQRCVDQKRWWPTPVRGGSTGPNLADTSQLQRHGGDNHSQHISSGSVSESGDSSSAQGFRNDWWQTEPDVGRVADGVSSRVDRLRAIGNAQVPQVAALAWNTLIEMES